MAAGWPDEGGREIANAVLEEFGLMKLVPPVILHNVEDTARVRGATTSTLPSKRMRSSSSAPLRAASPVPCGLSWNA
jgi:hypothetical protein